MITVLKAIIKPYYPLGARGDHGSRFQDITFGADMALLTFAQHICFP